ncbi:unnamed protein product [Cuscuta epithymum]|uniref:Homeobox protein knotted-1-like 1 n=1 Tax=Cuscuta epithymum TaxID=186058 RepID=A0AAV0GAV9_9ASTE|nr:unnamed protein product [Cuscuta epithymum]
MMDELYGIHSVLAPSSSTSTSYAPSSNNNGFCLESDGNDHHRRSSMINGYGEDLQSQHHLMVGQGGGGGGGGVDEMMVSDDVKAQIANHPLYPNLVSAYIQCRKVAAPPEMATILEEISQVSPHPTTTTTADEIITTNPELDEFMESYCDFMYKYKEELSKPFDEAKTFLSGIESQLNSLCKDTLPTTTTFNIYHSCDEGGGTSEEEVISCGEAEVGETEMELWSSSLNKGEGDQQIKETLMRKYSGYLSSLRKDFLKKRKKGKLPKDARVALLHWWTSHYRWPYPTEEEKNKLSEMTGLDQKQINNWFINQRKRHWRPSEDMRFALLEGINGESCRADNVL